MAFNRAKAKQAGYSDQEIDQYLASKQNVAGESAQMTSGNDAMLSPEFVGRVLGGYVPKIAGKVAPAAKVAGLPATILQTAFAGLGSGVGKTLEDPSPENIRTTVGSVFPPVGLVDKWITRPEEFGGTGPTEAGKAISEGVISEAALIGLMKLLRPFKTVGEVRNTLAGRSSGQISGDTLMKTIQSTSPPVSDQATYLKLLEEAGKRFGGKTLSVAEGVGQKEIAGHAARTARGQVGRSAEAFFEEQIRKNLQSQIAQQAPGVAAADKMFEGLYGGRRIIDRFLGPIIMGAVLKGTGGGGSF